MNTDCCALLMLAESDSPLLQTLQLRVLRTTAQCTAPPSVARNTGDESSPASLSSLRHGLSASSWNRTDMRQHGLAAHSSACWTHLPPTRHKYLKHTRGNNPTREGAVGRIHRPKRTTLTCAAPPTRAAVRVPQDNAGPRPLRVPAQALQARQPWPAPQHQAQGPTPSDATFFSVHPVIF